MSESVKPVKRKWHAGQDIVSKYKIGDFELFDLMKAGVQVRTYTGKKVVNSDSLPKEKRYSLEYFYLLELGKEETDEVITRSQTLGPWSLEDIKQKAMQKALCRFDDQPLEILDPPDPKYYALIDFTLPADNHMANLSIGRAYSFQFLAVDVDKFFDNEYYQHTPLISEETLNKTANTQKLQEHVTTEQRVSVNFFTKKSSFWDVGYEDKTGTIKALDGIHYIVALLETQGKSISCRKLFQVVSGKTQDKVMPEGAAISEGLNVGRNSQHISDYKAKIDYKNKYLKLQNDLKKAESEIEREEIEKEMETIISHLKGKTFADPNDKKAQINISKRLDTAYKAISKTGMKEMAKHLQDNIKTDDAYGLRYTGNITWDIIL